MPAFFMRNAFNEAWPADDKKRALVARLDAYAAAAGVVTC